MMKTLLVSVLSLCSLNAVAAGFACSEDMRAVDGMYKEIVLVDAGNHTHDLVFKSVGTWDSAVSEKKLATGLTCSFAKDSRIAYCSKKEDAAEGKPSLLFAKKIEITQLGALEAATGTPSRQSFVDIEIRSPSITNGKAEFRFPFSQCKAQQ